MKTTCKFLIIILSLLASTAYAREHLIYSVAEEVPMGYDNEVIKKNYYVNIGGNQGVKEGTILDVFRIISKSNPYDNLKRINYRVKIGEIKVLHSDDEAAIGSMMSIRTEEAAPLFDIRSFMIGDYVTVSVGD